MGYPFSLLGGDIAWNDLSEGGDETEDLPGLVLIAETGRAGLTLAVTRTFPDSAPTYTITLPPGSDKEAVLVIVGPFWNPDDLTSPTPSGPLRVNYLNGIDKLRIAACMVFSGEWRPFTAAATR